VLHKKAIVVDCGVDVSLLRDLKYFQELRRGGVDVAVPTVPVKECINFPSAVEQIDYYTQIIEDNSEEMLLATSIDDIRKAVDQEKVAMILDFQDARPIEQSLAFLKAFQKLGIRVIQLTYNSQNFVGSGCCELSCGGLTFFGREVVQELNRLGIVIDLSHCCDNTTIEAIELSRDPVIFSHANSRTLCNTLRNKSDDQIKALSEKGGVIGVTIFPICVRMEGEPMLSDILKQIDYLVKLVGVDHVGIGLDLNRKGVDVGIPSVHYRMWRTLRPDIFGTGPLDKYPSFPKDLERHTDLINVTRGLVSMGYSDNEIEKILGSNFLRVFEKVWH